MTIYTFYNKHTGEFFEEQMSIDAKEKLLKECTELRVFISATEIKRLERDAFIYFL